jgi:L-asparagine transporter-like permease
MKKSIGFFGIFSISAGAMISSGLFVLPGLAFAQAGPAVFLSYFIAGAIALTSVVLDGIHRIAHNSGEDTMLRITLKADMRYNFRVVVPPNSKASQCVIKWYRVQ